MEIPAGGHFDGTEIYSDSASFLMMNPLSPHKEEASAVLAAMIDPKYGLYTSPTSLLYYYKDFLTVQRNALKKQSVYRSLPVLIMRRIRSS